MKKLSNKLKELRNWILRKEELKLIAKMTYQEYLNFEEKTSHESK